MIGWRMLARLFFSNNWRADLAWRRYGPRASGLPYCRTPLICFIARFRGEEQ